MTLGGWQKRSLFAMVLAGSMALAAAASAAPAASARPPVSVVKTDALMSALKAGNYTAAEALFDERMKAAVPMEQLRGTWEGLVMMLGPLVSWTFEAPTAAQSMEQRMGSLRFEHGEAKAMVVTDPKTGMVTGFFIRPPSPPETGHASYVDTTAFRAVDLKVGTDPYLLGATLTIPTGPGRFPAAVLIHGSGPQDRDETVGANRVFRDLAEGLSSKGVAVLRYDKRTKVYGAKMGSSTSIDDEVILDALAALRQLAARPEVDPKRVFVIGHSLGALLAPEIGVRSGNVAGVVALAPPRSAAVGHRACPDALSRSAARSDRGHREEGRDPTAGKGARGEPARCERRLLAGLVQARRGRHGEEARQARARASRRS